MSDGATAFAGTAEAAAYVPYAGAEQVLAALEQWACEAEGPVCVLRGPEGAGKSMLLAVLAARVGRHAVPVSVSALGLDPETLARTLLDALGTPWEGSPRVALARAIERPGARRLLLLVDDGDALAPRTEMWLFDFVRRSAGAVRALLAVRDARLAAELAAAFQAGTRVLALDAPMSREETEAWIRAELNRGGVDEALRARFDALTVGRLHTRSGGLPGRLQQEAAAILADVAAESRLEAPRPAVGHDEPPRMAASRGEPPRLEVRQEEAPIRDRAPAVAAGSAPSAGAGAAAGAPRPPALAADRPARDRPPAPATVPPPRPATARREPASRELLAPRASAAARESVASREPILREPTASPEPAPRESLARAVNVPREPAPQGPPSLRAGAAARAVAAPRPLPPDPTRPGGDDEPAAVAAGRPRRDSLLRWLLVPAALAVAYVTGFLTSQMLEFVRPAPTPDRVAVEPSPPAESPATAPEPLRPAASPPAVAERAVDPFAPPPRAGEAAPSALVEREPSGLVEREPSGLAEREPSGLVEREPSGLVEREPSGLAERKPSGLAERKPSGLAERAPDAGEEPALPPVSAPALPPVSAPPLAAAATAPEPAASPSPEPDEVASEPAPRAARAAPAAARRPAPPRRVAVSVEAEPGAAVLIDGRPVGVGSVDGLQLPPGPHRVEVRLPDGRVVERVVEVRGTRYDVKVR